MYLFVRIRKLEHPYKYKNFCRREEEYKGPNGHWTSDKKDAKVYREIKFGLGSKMDTYYDYTWKIV